MAPEQLKGQPTAASDQYALGIMITALSPLGYAVMMRSNYAAARALLEEALALFREVGDTGGCALNHHTLHL